MTFLIIVGLVGLLIYYAFIRQPSVESRLPNNRSIDLSSDSLSSKSQYLVFPGLVWRSLVGIEHHEWIKEGFGFPGYVEPEKNNPYDRFAVAVYSSDRSKVGYISRYDNEELSNTLNDKLNSHAYALYDVTTYNGHLTGEVFIFLGVKEEMFNKILVYKTIEKNLINTLNRLSTLSGSSFISLTQKVQEYNTFLANSPFNLNPVLEEFHPGSRDLWEKVKSLEELKDWKTLSKLQASEDFFREFMGGNYLSGTLKRIKRGVEMTS